MANELKCPICDKNVETTDNKAFPFCSKRCQLIDLGRWCNGDYELDRVEPREDEQLQNSNG